MRPIGIVFYFSTLSGVFAQSGENCTFQRDPEEFLLKQERAFRSVNDRTMALGKLRGASGARTVNAWDLPWRNMVDEEILGRLEKDRIPVAPLTTDDEFVRRIYLDLIGRLPRPEEISAFVKDATVGKRDGLIDRLLFTSEFSYRWAAWLGDLVGTQRTATNVNQQNDGRNAMYNYLVSAVGNGKSLREVAWELLAGSGNNYESGPANWGVRTITPGGPVQDRYDAANVRAASVFLGLGHYDCLTCHDGRRHLDELSLWGKSVTRMDTFRMAAHFSRQNVAGRPNIAGNFFTNSFDVSDRPTGTYDLSTNFGNRPNRVRVGTILNVTPEYRNGKVPASGQGWREAYATELVGDPMFAKNLANRLFKQIFNLGLVEPVDQLDPARLDPDQAPAAPWSFQTQHVRLLARLASQLAGTDYNLREALRVLVSSTSYQLSSRYEGEWRPDYVPLYARHYARRLEAEELHDALAQASGNLPTYTIVGFGEAVRSAWVLPDTSEPQSNAGNGRNFMDVFLRGNRDTQVRRQDGSILQQLALMNDQFVRDRIRVASSSNLLAASRMTDPNAIVSHMFPLYLGRDANATERQKSVLFLSRATTAAAKNTAIEDLAWTLVNKIDFLYSY